MSEDRSPASRQSGFETEEEYLVALRAYAADDSRREAWRRFNDARRAWKIERVRSEDPARRLLDLSL